MAVIRRGVGWWGGLAFALGHFLFLMNKYNEMSRLFLGRSAPDLISGRSAGLVILGQALLLFGYITYYLVYARCAGRWCRDAIGLTSTGGILLALGHITFITEVGASVPPSIKSVGEDFFLLVVVGVLLLLTGLIWFGVLNLRRRILIRWQWLPLVTGLMGFCGFVLSGGEEVTVTFLVFRTLFALGLIGLGITLGQETATMIPKVVARAA